MILRTEKQQQQTFYGLFYEYYGRYGAERHSISFNKVFCIPTRTGRNTETEHSTGDRGRQ